jgi:hypothetical protein
MRKLMLLLAMVVVAITASAQMEKYGYAVVNASEADTNKNGETDYLVIPNTGQFTVPQSLTIMVGCVDQYEGTSDGTLTIEGSLDGVLYKNLTDEEYPDMSADTITIADGVNATWVIPKTYFSKYRIKVVGTSGDTTLLKPRYKFQPYK